MLRRKLLIQAMWRRPRRSNTHTRARLQLGNAIEVFSIHVGASGEIATLACGHAIELGCFLARPATNEIGLDTLERRIDQLGSLLAHEP